MDAVRNEVARNTQEHLQVAAGGKMQFPKQLRRSFMKRLANSSCPS